MNTTADTTEPRRLLVISASVGAGHNAAAKAVVARIKEIAPGVQVDLLDAISLAPRLFRGGYAGGFALSMSRFPTIYGLGYRLTNRPQTPRHSRAERVRLAVERRALKRLAQWLIDARPELIVHTHFLAPPVVAWLNRTHALAARQFVVVTDREMHRYWYCQGVEHWFVPCRQAAATLGRWAIPSARITVSGIPTHPKWAAPVDRAKALSDWRLPSDKKIVLVSGGTDFTCGPIVKIARSIVAASDDSYVVVLAGRNKKLLGRICKLPEAPSRLTAIGFTDRLHELTAVCSVMVTKPGGVTTAECLARGVAMVLLKPVPGHEAGNARQLAEAGAAIITTGTKDLAAQVARLLADDQTRARIAGCAAKLHRPASDTVARAICGAYCPARPAHDLGSRDPAREL